MGGLEGACREGVALRRGRCPRIGTCILDSSKVGNRRCELARINRRQLEAHQPGELGLFGGSELGVKCRLEWRRGDSKEDVASPHLIEPTGSYPFQTTKCTRVRGDKKSVRGRRGRTTLRRLPLHSLYDSPSPVIGVHGAIELSIMGASVATRQAHLQLSAASLELRF